MKRRAWKMIGLMAAGGMVLQAVGCASVVAQTIASNLLPLLLQVLLQQALGVAAGTAS